MSRTDRAHEEQAVWETSRHSKLVKLEVIQNYFAPLGEDQMLTQNSNNALTENNNATGSKVQLRGILLNDFMRGILLNDFMRGTLLNDCVRGILLND
jgi:hypothetical protein